MDDKFYFPTKALQPIAWTNVEEVQFPVEKDTINAIILKPNQNAKATIFTFTAQAETLLLMHHYLRICWKTIFK